MDTCGQCAHAKMIPGNLMQRACKGAPPQLVVVPAGLGAAAGFQMTVAYPNVGVGDEACGMFKRRAVEIETQDESTNVG